MTTYYKYKYSSTVYTVIDNKLVNYVEINELYSYGERPDVMNKISEEDMMLELL